MELTGLKNRRKQFEEEFFVKENAKLLAKIQEKKKIAETRMVPNNSCPKK